jgi:hypothetical protein
MARKFVCKHRVMSCGVLIAAFTKRGFNFMNILVKTAVAGALALGATGAFAMGVPNTNDSDLILVVVNLSTNATYALDTGISLNSVLPTASVVKGDNLSTAIPGINQTIAASPALQAFLAANPVAGDGWTVEGGQFNGGGVNNSTNSNSNAVGAAKMLFTSGTGTNVNGVVNQFTLGNLVAFSNGINNDVNTGGLLNALTTGTETTGSGLYPGPAQQKYGLLGAPDTSSIGTASELFGYTGNATAGVLNSYILGTVNLGTDGTLTFSANQTSAVPLPAAAWLFGSGLMGLVGVSRRRKAAV